MRLAQSHRLFQHCIEHRRQVARRRVDHLQYFSRRGLLIQRFSLLGEKSGVFDSDDRLIGEGVDKFYLPIRKRFHSSARNQDGTDWFAGTQERHSKRGSLLAKLDSFDGIARNGGHVVNVHHAAFRDCPVCYHRRVRNESVGPDLLQTSRIFWWKSNIGHHFDDAVLMANECCLIGGAKPRRCFGHHGEYGSQIEGRAADDLQHVAGRGLVSSDSRRSAVRACKARYVLALLIAIAACSAKVCNSAT